jgi:dipeptidyl-peptidase-4
MSVFSSNRKYQELLMKRFGLITFLLVGFVFSGAAQQTDPSILTLDRIFASSDFDPQGLGPFRWLKSGDSYTKLEAAGQGKKGRDLVAYDAASGSRRVLVGAERFIPQSAAEPIAVQNYDWSADDKKLLIYTNSKKVWRLNTRGDYWVLDLAANKLTKLGGDAKPSTLMFAKFSPDGSKVGYVRENNIYVENLSTGKITQLTNNGSPTLINGTSDWVNEEEFFLRDCWRWSPDSRSIAFWQFDASGIETFYLINNTDSLYPKLTPIPYPKVGTTNAAVRIGVISADGGEIRWMKTPGDPRQNYIAMMEWAGNSNELIMQHLNRLQNTLSILMADASTGEVHPVAVEKDEAWVDVDLPTMNWVDDGKRFLWLSDRSGWQHIYSVSRDGRDTRELTKGDFDALSISGIDETGGWVYYIASPENAAQRYLYRVRLDGSGRSERVTPASHSGWNSYNISPGAKWAVHNWSAFGKAPKSELVNLGGTAPSRPMVTNDELQAAIDKLKKGPEEFIKVDIGGGTVLDGWMIKPPGFDPNRKYPVLFYVYGEPAGQTVMDNWGGTNYLWHRMLAQQGYIVASVDNRGTPAPRGRQWRKMVYRKIGVISSADQAAAVKLMTAKMPYLDASRVGIWGWSGGGSSTLQAMFRYPDVYRMGMSVAPVPDQTLYDTIYQERYMGLPQDNPQDFQAASPINFAQSLKGDLLVVHGTGDDNVHYQGTERLINKLIALNKQFQMMSYPNRSHGIFEGENTTRHLFGLLTAYLNEHLPLDKSEAVLP